MKKINFLESLIANDSIQMHMHANTWQEAVEMVFAPLVAANGVSKEYPSNVIKKTMELGPYYIITPNVAMPHSRPEDGALKNVFSLMILDSPVAFDKKSSAQILIGFAAIDNETHLSLALPQIVAIFEKQDTVIAMLNAKTQDNLIKIIRDIDYMKYVK